jgi:hypothetical protein
MHLLWECLLEWPPRPCCPGAGGMLPWESFSTAERLLSVLLSESGTAGSSGFPPSFRRLEIAPLNTDAFDSGQRCLKE